MELSMPDHGKPNLSEGLKGTTSLQTRARTTHVPRLNAECLHDDIGVRPGDHLVGRYLRDNQSANLLSREGEVAIAKRIEAGRRVVIVGLCGSPLISYPGR